MTASCTPWEQQRVPWHCTTIKDMTDAAGITMPDKMEDALTWSEFADIAGKADHQRCGRNQHHHG